MATPVAMEEEFRGPPISVVERYFTTYYAVDVKGRKGEDQCVLQHSNKLCMVCLSQNHPVMEEDIAGVDFFYDSKMNLSGKMKNELLPVFTTPGGQRLTPTSPLCFVQCKGGRKYCLYSCVKGSLLEVNEELLTNPSLLQSKPWSEGFIALVLPKLSEAHSICSGLLSKEEYAKHLDERSMSQSRPDADESEDIQVLDSVKETDTSVSECPE